MAKNTGELAKALKGGHRMMRGSVAVLANRVLTDLKAAVSGPYPPASAAGTPPHLRTGAYRAGLNAAVSGFEFKIKARGFANNIAIWTEFGTHKDGKPFMRPRPHWRVVVPVSVVRHAGILGKALERGERSR